MIPIINNTFSASKVNKFLACPLLYKHDYLDGRTEKEPPNIYMIFGTAIHYAMEIYYKEVKDKGVRKSVDTVIEAFVYKFEKEIAEHKIKEKQETINAMLMSARTLLGYYVTKVACNIVPILIEHEFRIKLEKYPFEIHGFIDLVTEDKIITDLKTGGHDWKKQFTPSKLAKSVQLLLYAVAYRKIFKSVERGISFHVFPRHDVKTHDVSTFVIEEDILKNLDTIHSIKKILDLGVLMPNLSNCSGCPLNSTCPKKPWLRDHGGFQM